MGSIDSKLSSGAGLSDKEKGFINTTSAPVLKYLTNSRSMGMSPTYLLQVAGFGQAWTCRRPSTAALSRFCRLWLCWAEGSIAIIYHALAAPGPPADYSSVPHSA
jgi:NADH:ubiquinone oxidoreductase subunit E